MAVLWPQTPVDDALGLMLLAGAAAAVLAAGWTWWRWYR
jgi:hypothetical protein